MLVLRRFAPITAAVLALLAPPLGRGSDASHAAIEPAARRAPAALDGPSGDTDPGRLPDSLGLGAEAWDGAPAVPAPLSPGHGAKAGFHPAVHPRELLLSFDDGPDLKGTPLILDELDRRGLKAIFFVTGWRLTGDHPAEIARRDLVRKIASHGHLVANHTMTHKNLCLNPADQAAEIDGASEIVAQATGVRPLLFRAPYGAYCRSLELALAARELPDIGWNLDPEDWRDTDERAIFKYVTGKLAHLDGRGILLMHDTHLASVNTLGLILDWIERENRRSLEAGRPPITFIDYSVLLPARQVTRSGLETIVAGLAGEIGASLGRLLGH
jgi:peptidoglycan/xylan/chitin deacetylase (PgdA/CDA1 family)